MTQLVLPFYEQETDALRASLQEAAERERLMTSDIKTLRKAIIALGTANLDPNDPQLIRARQVYGAILLVDGIGAANE